MAKIPVRKLPDKKVNNAHFPIIQDTARCYCGKKATHYARWSIAGDEIHELGSWTGMALCSPHATKVVLGDNAPYDCTPLPEYEDGIRREMRRARGPEYEMTEMFPGLGYRAEDET